MTIKIKTTFGLTTWGSVIAWNMDGTAPFLVDTPYGILQNNSEGYYFSV